MNLGKKRESGEEHFTGSVEIVTSSISLSLLHISMPTDEQLSALVLSSVVDIWGCDSVVLINADLIRLDAE